MTTARNPSLAGLAVLKALANGGDAWQYVAPPGTRPPPVFVIQRSNLTIHPRRIVLDTLLKHGLVEYEQTEDMHAWFITDAGMIAHAAATSGAPAPVPDGGLR